MDNVNSDEKSCDTMMANVYQGKGKPSKWMRMPKPVVEKDTDVIIKVHKTTICGTDLSILDGNVSTTKPGIILGHEGIGIIVEAGSAVKKYKVGERILISCITACGLCEACKNQAHAFCIDGGWELGNTIHGMQAEFCRVCQRIGYLNKQPVFLIVNLLTLFAPQIPHADYTAYFLPDSIPLGSDEENGYVMAWFVNIFSPLHALSFDLFEFDRYVAMSFRLHTKSVFAVAGIQKIKKPLLLSLVRISSLLCLNAII